MSEDNQKVENTKGAAVTDDSTKTPIVKTNEDNVGGGEQNDSKPRELTRSKMALLFVLGFFAILFLCFAYGFKVNASLSELKDVLIGIIGALSGTLGFIVGFYYKSLKEQ